MQQGYLRGARLRQGDGYDPAAYPYCCLLYTSGQNLLLAAGHAAAQVDHVKLIEQGGEHVVIEPLGRLAFEPFAHQLLHGEGQG